MDACVCSRMCSGVCVLVRACARAHQNVASGIVTTVVVEFFFQSFFCARAHQNVGGSSDDSSSRFFFRQVGLAYKVLRDADLRRIYHACGWRGLVQSEVQRNSEMCK